ncbi:MULTISPECIES: ABC transporter substrate-binding protein [unclassified Rathayibacter]|uniref:ABC transporter substrate-binding protein n=1 Tax=unclassified Rathayibacter TaxID=2609250 RepID=UPI001045879E|nr:MULTISPECIES: ABC transporter substrate-binding protein [unclassified Rathayibacter]MCJ1702226.1 ABC transporter substrate-binding protein [Rathayibacter sp. VKM Ac-2926]TCL85405.1 peptide/nickel transport system substrate-binding protein [Rathayibacter sp. PhB192]TCM31226.1 peptide/nickel transport system substrate-binding protein [Rathayibacter sp. PhB179]
MITRTRRLALAATALASAFVLSACSAGAGASSSGSDGEAHAPTAIIGLTGEPANLDFTTTAGAAIPQALMNNVYEGLVAVGQDGQLEPKLASSWTVSEDGLEYDFVLNEGVTFSNGAEFTADDVKFSLERVKTDWAINQAKMAVLDRVDVVSPTEAKVVLSRPSNSWLFDMGGSVGLMFDESGVADLANTPVGTGPYTVTERVTGDRIELAARDGYWGEAPAVTDVTLRYFADAVASTNALRAGDVDMLYNMQAPDLVAQFETNDDFQVIQGTSNGEIMLSMNNAKAPFDDLKVRQAVAYALDRQAIIDTAWAGYGKLIGAMVPPTDPYYEDLTGEYAYDPEKARELLAEAGAEDLSITFDVPTRPYATAVSEVVVSQLADVGIDATIASDEFPAVWLDKVFTRHDYEMSVILAVEPRDFLANFGDPDYYLGYDNAEVRTAADAADAASQDEWVTGMQDVVADVAADVPAVPLFLFPNIVIADSGLTGIAGNSVTESLDLTGLAWS